MVASQLNQQIILLLKRPLTHYWTPPPPPLTFVMNVIAICDKSLLVFIFEEEHLCSNFALSFLDFYALSFKEFLFEKSRVSGGRPIQPFFFFFFGGGGGLAA